MDFLVGGIVGFLVGYFAKDHIKKLVSKVFRRNKDKSITPTTRV